MVKHPLGLIVEVHAWFIYILEWFCEFMLVWMLVGVVLRIIMVLTNYSIVRVGSSIPTIGHPW